MNTLKINLLSEQLLLAVKMEEPTDELVAKLAKLELEQLKKELSNDQLKKAFWINIYNAFFQILRLGQKIDKSKVYKINAIEIAGNKLSLDDIEHGILRRFRFKFSLGYLPNIFAPTLIKKLAVSKMDYRIHFALNCGAKSCPPIAFYSSDKIEQQLEMATMSFLEGETSVKNAAKQIVISRLFQWYIGDFGGRKGIRQILKKKLGISHPKFKLTFNDYSWEESLSNYSEDSFS